LYNLCWLVTHIQGQPGYAVSQVTSFICGTVTFLKFSKFTNPKCSKIILKTKINNFSNISDFKYTLLFGWGLLRWRYVRIGHIIWHIRSLPIYLRFVILTNFQFLKPLYSVKLWCATDTPCWITEKLVQFKFCLPRNGIVPIAKHFFPEHIM
jgi:hypothetical protein